MPDIQRGLARRPENKLSLTPKYLQSIKFNRWVKYFLDKDNKATFGNRTQSALRAYSLDPVTQYNSAATIGKENFKKLQNMSAEMFEIMDIGLGELVKTGYNIIKNRGTYSEWRELMTDLGYFEEKPPEPKQQVVNVQNIINSWMENK